MTVGRKHTQKNTLYYTTFTCHQWNSYIQLADAWDAVYKGFDDMKRLYGVLLTGYVIMPNHLHSMLYVPEDAPDINALISDQKRFLAYEIVELLEIQHQYTLLQKMKNDLTGEECAKKQKHKVFKGLSDIKECYSEWFIEQKLDYMHRNPVSGKWNLVDDYTRYPHSSAGYYELNYSKNPTVEYVQLNNEVKLYYTPNDPNYPSQWNLSQIQCPDGWDYSLGESIIAIVDSGINVTHPDIAANLWKDNKGNIGYNFYHRNNDTSDKDGHGSHVAGISGALINNNIGIVGVAPKSKIMVVKAFHNGNSSDDICANSIRYAVAYGAHVINNSWGMTKRTPSNKLLESVVEYAYAKNCIVVFAAGNEKDDIKYYSPNNTPYVISVGSTTSASRRARTSNYGNIIGAPGEDISSLSRRGIGYQEMSGTSMAAPHVAGLAALMLKINRGLNFSLLKFILEKNADLIMQDPGMPMNLGRINIARTIQATLSTVLYNITLRVRGTVNDDDGWFGDTQEDYEYFAVVSLLPGGPSELRTFQKCVGGEVSLRMYITVTMSNDRTLQIATVLNLLEGTDCSGDLEAEIVLPAKWLKKQTTAETEIIINQHIEDKQGDWATFNLWATNPAP